MDYTDFIEMPKDKILIFGGSGGLGQKLSPVLAQYFEVHTLNSKSVDILNPRELRQFIDEHKPQCIVNMAVINEDSTIIKLDPDSQCRMQAVNMQGATNILQASLQYFRTFSCRGSYIYTSSILSTRPVKGAGMYSATKAFNDSLIKTAALENARYDITCNSIQLGYFDGGLTYKLPEDFRQSLIERIPVRRLGSAIDLCQAICFLHSNRYITGITLDLSGGCAL